ncbi:ras-related protein rab-4b-like [Stylonychia lemnae]|uniref:Ras-related protein rab-4b-like n=1 Tax=Stylonychia lemnae TaxID=5949 RepID=A0A078B3C0_STYLE|nr:ras-related protein rab-4b-like [Stylonychia lemnae]|eukprot:CDW87998.1 ras-related protein rab-4b-like [Stylonychia lemnae]
MEFEMKEKYDLLFKYIIIGDTSVGKSCILHQYLRNKFDSNSKHTIGVEFGIKYLKINDQIIKIQIWDTAGQERYKSITRGYFRGSLGVIIVYDITSLDSYQHVQQWLNEARQFSRQEATFIMVGNKKDNEQDRVVQMTDAAKFAQENETSALSGENVEEVFNKMTHTIIYKIESGEIPDELILLQKHNRIAVSDKQLGLKIEDLSSKGWNNYEQIIDKSQLQQLRHLGAEILSLIAAGERQLQDFRAYDIFNEIARSSQTLKSSTLTQADKEGTVAQKSKDEVVIEEKALYCFFKKQFQPEILEGDITDSEVKYLIKIIDTQNNKKLLYEDFLSFILPRTKKKFSRSILRKVKKHEKLTQKKSYDSICSIGRLLEKEIEILRLISQSIKRYQRKNKCDLQICDLFTAIDLGGHSRLTRKSRLDTDKDDELCFSDFFSGILPYFLFCQKGLKAKRAKSNADKKFLQPTANPLNDKSSNIINDINIQNSQRIPSKSLGKKLGGKIFKRGGVSKNEKENMKPEIPKREISEVNQDLQETEATLKFGTTNKQYQMPDSIEQQSNSMSRQCLRVTLLNNTFTSSKKHTQDSHNQTGPSLQFEVGLNESLKNIRDPNFFQKKSFLKSQESLQAKSVDRCHRPQTGNIRHETPSLINIETSQNKSEAGQILYKNTYEENTPYKIQEFYSPNIPNQCLNNNYDSQYSNSKFKTGQMNDVEIYKNQRTSSVRPGSILSVKQSATKNQKKQESKSPNKKQVKTKANQASQTNLAHLYKFFHECIDFDRIIEIDKQLPEIANDQMIRQKDFLILFMPRNAEFAMYLNRKSRQDFIEAEEQELLMKGISEETHLRLLKFFQDFIALESELENQRHQLQNQLTEEQIKIIFKSVDKNKKGHAIVEDYLEYFKDHYNGGMPFTNDDIHYLFKRHDRYRVGKVLEQDFIKELTPFPLNFT